MARSKGLFVLGIFAASLLAGLALTYQTYPQIPASYVIWTDGTTYYAKSGTDGTITTNSNFATLMNALITSMDDGLIFIKEGRYTQTAPIYGKSHVYLEGECISDQAQLDGVVIQTSGNIVALNITSQHYIIIKNIKWESDGVSNDYGIYFKDSSYCTFERVFVFNYDYCLYYVAGTYFMNTWRECNFKDGRTWSIYGPPSIQSVFIDTQITDAWFAGGQMLVLDNCWVEGNYANGAYGCRIHQMNGFKVTGCYFENQAGGTGVILLDIGDASKGGIVEGNSFDCNDKVNNRAIAVGNAGAVLSGIRIGANYFTACPTEILIGANVGNTKIDTSHGFITENSGTATLLNGNTAIVVTHGCDYTPSAGDIQAHPIETLNNADFWWVDTITATQFTIHTDQDPGADVDFAWSVDRH